MNQTLTVIHDTDSCSLDNGQPCSICKWAAESERAVSVYPASYAQGLVEWELFKAMSDYRKLFGDEAFMAITEKYMAESGLY